MLEIILVIYLHIAGGGYEYSMPPPPPPVYHPPAHVHEEYVHVEKESHGLGLSELFDISLTGIAFLSFGMFVLQVLMCITMVSNSKHNGKYKEINTIDIV